MPTVVYTDVENKTSEACQKFIQIDKCLYSNSKLGRCPSFEVFMECDCKENWINGSNLACNENEDCINRLTQIECVNEVCSQCGIDCQNQRFQQRQYADISIIQTEKKGYGVIAQESIEANQFIYEYVGEVISESEFNERLIAYDLDLEKRKHFYFMMLQKGEFIDATSKGCLARFCNHSCNPNAFVSKWVVAGKLRMGIFAKKDIQLGEEITFDYNVDRYGAKPQKCYCGEPNCIGVLGGKIQTETANLLPDAFLAALGTTRAVERKYRQSIKNVNAKAKPEFDEEGVNMEFLQTLPMDPMENKDDVNKVIAALLQTRSQNLCMKLIQRVVKTEDETLKLEIIKFHGYSAFFNVLDVLKKKNKYVKILLKYLLSFPKSFKDTIQSSRIENMVKDLGDTFQYGEVVDLEIPKYCTALLEKWASFEMYKRIRKVEPSTKDDSTSSGHFSRKLERKQERLSETPAQGGTSLAAHLGYPISQTHTSRFKDNAYPSQPHWERNAVTPGTAAPPTNGRYNSKFEALARDTVRKQLKPSRFDSGPPPPKWAVRPAGTVFNTPDTKPNNSNRFFTANYAPISDANGIALGSRLPVDSGNSYANMRLESPHFKPKAAQTASPNAHVPAKTEKSTPIRTSITKTTQIGVEDSPSNLSSFEDGSTQDQFKLPINTSFEYKNSKETKVNPVSVKLERTPPTTNTSTSTFEQAPAVPSQKVESANLARSLNTKTNTSLSPPAVTTTEQQAHKDDTCTSFFSDRTQKPFEEFLKSNHDKTPTTNTSDGLPGKSLILPPIPDFQMENSDKIEQQKTSQSVATSNRVPKTHLASFAPSKTKTAAAVPKTALSENTPKIIASSIVTSRKEHNTKPKELSKTSVEKLANTHESSTAVSETAPMRTAASRPLHKSISEMRGKISNVSGAVSKLTDDEDKHLPTVGADTYIGKVPSKNMAPNTHIEAPKVIADEPRSSMVSPVSLEKDHINEPSAPKPTRNRFQNEKPSYPHVVRTTNYKGQVTSPYNSRYSERPYTPNGSRFGTSESRFNNSYQSSSSYENRAQHIPHGVSNKRPHEGYESGYYNHTKAPKTSYVSTEPSPTAPTASHVGVPVVSRNVHVNQRFESNRVSNAVADNSNLREKSMNKQNIDEKWTPHGTSVGPGGFRAGSLPYATDPVSETKRTVEHVLPTANKFLDEPPLKQIGATSRSSSLNRTSYPMHVETSEPYTNTNRRLQQSGIHKRDITYNQASLPFDMPRPTDQFPAVTPPYHSPRTKSYSSKDDSRGRRVSAIEVSVSNWKHFFGKFVPNIIFRELYNQGLPQSICKKVVREFVHSLTDKQIQKNNLHPPSDVSPDYKKYIMDSASLYVLKKRGWIMSMVNESDRHDF